MTEREQNLSTADIAGQQTESTREVDDSEQPLDRDPDTQEALPEQPKAEGDASELEPLLPAGDADGFRGRWESIQTAFVDSPREAVQDADGLVAELMQRLAQSFTEERESLEKQWSRGDDVSTEDLRVGLQRYRSFFERLLST